MAYLDQYMDLVARDNKGVLNIYAYRHNTDQLIDLTPGYFNNSRFATDAGFKGGFLIASLADGDHILAFSSDGQSVGAVTRNLPAPPTATWTEDDPWIEDAQWIE